MRGLIAVPIVLTALSACPAHARGDEQFWASAAATGHLASRVQGSADVVARSGDAADGLYQGVASASLGYDVAKNITVWAGYVYAPNYRDGDRVSTEQRIREQLTAVIARPGRATLALRVRGEQRWRDTAPGTGWRVRPQLKLSYPLSRGFTVFASSEPFVNLNRTAFQQHGFDRIRNATGIGIPLLKKVRLEAGYLDQHIRVRGGADERDHVLTTALAVSF